MKASYKVGIVRKGKMYLFKTPSTFRLARKVLREAEGHFGSLTRKGDKFELWTENHLGKGRVRFHQGEFQLLPSK